MRDSPSPVLVIAALLALFPGAAAVGVGLARWLAPGSWVADAVSFFALPVAFATGLQIWYGVALFGMLVRLVGRWRAGAVPVRDRAVARPPLPGSVVFLPLSSGAGAIAGLVAGLVSSTQPAWLVMLVYWLVGTLHGVVAWRLARRGVLMPPESV
jgi:hypothetical protein